MRRLTVAATLVFLAAGGCGGSGGGGSRGPTGAGGGAGVTVGGSGAAGGGVGGGAAGGGAMGSGSGGGMGSVDAAAPIDGGAGSSVPDAGHADAAGGPADTSAGSDGVAEATMRTFVYVSGFAEDITTFTFDPAIGVLTRRSTVSTGANGEPSTMAFSPDKRFAYAVDEQRQAPLSTLLAYTINQTTGALQQINREPARGGVPASVAVDASGKWVLSANYGTGNVSVFPVRADGGLGTAMEPVPAGGQAHQIVFDSTFKFVFVPCLTARHIAQYRFADGVLTPNVPATVPIDGGPRHMAFTPDERFAYLLTQGQSTIVSFTHDKANGRLTPLQTVNSTPSGSLSAHIKVHPNGKFLYASNRTDNSISIFTIDAATGRLTRVGYQREMIVYPWHFAIDASGKFLIVANNRGASVLVNRIDQQTGTLQPVGAPVTVAQQPTFVGILPIP